MSLKRFENQITLDLKLAFDDHLKNVKSANMEIYYQGQRKLQYRKERAKRKLCH